MSSRILSFADGFTSVSAPAVSGAIQENFTILNNHTAGSILTLDSSINKTAFVNYELIRKTDDFYYKQEGSLIMAFNGTSWLLTEGNFQGDSLVNVEGVVNPQDLYLILNPSTGALTYNSGNLTGANYSGTLKLDITRIS